MALAELAYLAKGLKDEPKAVPSLYLIITYPPDPSCAETPLGAILS
jgi:hypothetical protein